MTYEQIYKIFEHIEHYRKMQMTNEEFAAYLEARTLEFQKELEKTNKFYAEFMAK